MVVEKNTYHLSIVIPALNAQKTLQRTLDSILKCDFSNISKEIIVIDNNSTDGTKEIIKNIPEIRYVFAPKRGRGHVRNVGLNEAKHEYICYVDADCTLKDDWFQVMLPYFSIPNLAAIQGRVIPAPSEENSIVDEFRIELAKRGTNEEFINLSILEDGFPQFNTAASLFRKSCLKTIDGFDSLFRYSEDHDVARRLLMKGYMLGGFIDGEAKVYWDGGTFFKYCLREFDVGYHVKDYWLRWSHSSLSFQFLRFFKSTIPHLKSYFQTRDKYWLRLFSLSIAGFIGGTLGYISVIPRILLRNRRRIYYKEIIPHSRPLRELNLNKNIRFCLFKDKIYACDTKGWLKQAMVLREENSLVLESLIKNPDLESSFQSISKIIKIEKKEFNEFCEDLIGEMNATCNQ